MGLKIEVKGRGRSKRRESLEFIVKFNIIHHFGLFEMIAISMLGVKIGSSERVIRFRHRVYYLALLKIVRNGKYN